MTIVTADSMRYVELRNAYGIDNLVVSNAPPPVPGDGQVLLRVRAVALNYRDLLIVRGHGKWKRSLPLIPASDAAGDVIAIGAGVTRAKVGDRICGIFLPTWLDGELTDSKDGPALGEMLAEFRVLDQQIVVQAPDYLSDVEAATLPCAAVTAWNALTGDSQVKSGDTVVVQGSGGVSLFALQLASAMGARVIALSRSSHKLDRLRSLGAADVIHTSAVDWPLAVRELTGGCGADHIIDVIGDLGESVEAIRSGGTIHVIGMLGGFATQVDPAAIMAKRARLRGLQVGSRSMFETMNRTLSLHGLKPVIERVFDLDGVRDAFRLLDSGQQFGKVCVRM